MNSNTFSANYFQKNDFLNESDREKLLSLVELVNYQENTVILKRGEIVSHVGVVLKGLLRVFDKNNRTVWFVPENQVYGSMEILALKRPTSLSYETLEETVMFLLNYEQLEEAIKTHPNIARLLLTYWKHTAMDIYSNFYSFLHLSPEERYLQLMKQDSKLILRVKSKDLATYLGIHPVSLSRLKKRYFTSHNKL